MRRASVLISLCHLALSAVFVFSVLPAHAAVRPAATPFAGRRESPTSPPRTLPPDARPPGERDPIVGGLAVASIIVAAAAGVYVYRVIRKGL